MAMVSGGKSTLNPNAPLFIPAAFRQVEDFSPEWWQLITTSSWYHDYWLSQHQGEDGFYDNAQEDDDLDSTNIADLLPDTFDLDAGENFSTLEAQFDDFVMSYETEVENAASPFPANAGFEKYAEIKDLSLLKSPKSALVPAKYADKPAKYVNPKCTNRRIQQPR